MTGQQRLAVLPSADPSPVPERWTPRRLVGLALGEGPQAVPWLLVGAAFLYLGFLLARFGHILSAVNWSSDAAFWPVLVEHLPPRGAGATNLGNTPHYATILFLALTRALPGHRTIWAWSPLLSSLAGVALIAWASRRAFGRRGAWFTLCVGACASFPVVQTIVPHGVRSWTWVAVAIMGALLAGLAGLLAQDRPGRRALVAGVAATVGTTVVAGITIASDPLFLAAGLGPFVAAAAVTWLRYPTRASRRLVLTAGAVVAGGLVLAPLVAGAMAGRGFRWTPVANAFSFASYDQLLQHLGWLGEALLAFGNGLFPSRPIGLTSMAMLASSAIGLAALFLTMTRSARMLLAPAAGGQGPDAEDGPGPGADRIPSSAARRGLGALGAPSGVPSHSAAGPVPLAARSPAAAPIPAASREAIGAAPPGYPKDFPHRPGRPGRAAQVQTAHVAYWSLSAAFVMGVYVVSTIPTGGGLASSRYLVPVFYAVAALLPLCLGEPGEPGDAGDMRRRVAARGRMSAVAAAAVFCMAGILGQNILVAFDRGPFPQTQDGRKVIAFLEHEGLTRGYAGYWDSHSITWHSQWATTVYPVGECRLPAPPSSSLRTLCPFDLATSTSWYRPQGDKPGVRTFVVTGGVGPAAAALTAAPPEAFGPPAQAATLGVYSVFVYDYDVASRFGPSAPTT